MIPALPSNTGAVVLLVHGTRNQRAGEVIRQSLGALCIRFAATLNLPESAVRYSFLEAMVPSLTQALEDLCQAGKQDIRIVPLLLFPGTHLYNDIPEITEAVMARFPGVSIHSAAHLGVEDGEFIDIMLKRLAETEPQNLTV